MQDREARELRRRVARLKRGRPGFRFSAPLRCRITAWVLMQRERGAWWCDLAREIGVSAETLRRWAAVRVFAFPAPVDLSKGYDGLYGLVQTDLGRDPLSGELFLFVNRSRRLCKVLLWDGTGLCIFQKRLEKGTFATLWRTTGRSCGSPRASSHCSSRAAPSSENTRCRRSRSAA